VVTTVDIENNYVYRDFDGRPSQAVRVGDSPFGATSPSYDTLGVGANAPYYCIIRTCQIHEVDSSRVSIGENRSHSGNVNGWSGSTSRTAAACLTLLLNSELRTRLSGSGSGDTVFRLGQSRKPVQSSIGGHQERLTRCSGGPARVTPTGKVGIPQIGKGSIARWNGPRLPEPFGSETKAPVNGAGLRPLSEEHSTFTTSCHSLSKNSAQN
jgi:hypothetical protein